MLVQIKAFEILNLAFRIYGLQSPYRLNQVSTWLLYTPEPG